MLVRHQCFSTLRSMCRLNNSFYSPLKECMFLSEERFMVARKRTVVGQESIFFFTSFTSPAVQGCSLYFDTVSP